MITCELQFNICISVGTQIHCCEFVLGVLCEDIILICYGHHQDGTIQLSFQIIQLFFLFFSFFNRKSCAVLLLICYPINGKSNICRRMDHQVHRRSHHNRQGQNYIMWLMAISLCTNMEEKKL